VRALSGPKHTFDILLDANRQSQFGALKIDVTVPDVIANIDDGDCCVCNGTRHICPGCTGGVADKFEVFMGCSVSLACPLCVGLDVSMEHMVYFGAVL